MTGRSGSKRPELIGLARRYLAALTAHNPSQVALTPGYRATENGAVAGLGSGLWINARAFPGHPGLVCDEVDGQVVVFGAVELEDGPHPIGLRLRIENAAVVESEAIISSSTRGFFADVSELLNADVIYEAEVTPERGCSRERLRAIANSYWNALAQSDGSLVEVNHRADRFANGKKVTNNLEILLSPDRAVHSVSSLLTATRPARPQVREKRFPVLDTDRGVAASIAVVDFADNPLDPRPDTGSFYILNVIKVVDGQIRIIDALHQIMPRGTISGWGSA